MTAGRWLVVPCLVLLLTRAVSAAIVIDMPPAPPVAVTATTQMYDGDSQSLSLGEVALARYASARTAPLYTYLSQPWPSWGYGGGYYGLGWTHGWSGFYPWGSGWGWPFPGGHWHSWGWGWGMGWNSGLWLNRPITFRTSSR